MYEVQTFEEILLRMLDRVPETFDKREGSIIYDALAPAAAELAQMYIELEYCFNQSFVDSADSDYLTRLCSQFGIDRKEATHTIAKGEFKNVRGNPFNVAIGTRFNIENLNYIVTEKISDGVYMLQCEEVGSESNSVLGRLIPIGYINGLTSAELTEILVPGEEIEDDETLRERYYEYVRNPAYGGNIADYKRKVKLLDGVGQVKVFPVWNGGGTVKLVLLDSDNDIPTQGLIDIVQEAVDPQPQQQGLGIAPIGHLVTVEGAEIANIHIETTIVCESGYLKDDIEVYIESVINKYLEEMAEEWEDKDLVVRIAHIESRILGIQGVVDVQGTLINGIASNFALSDIQIPKLASLVVN